MPNQTDAKLTMGERFRSLFGLAEKPRALPAPQAPIEGEVGITGTVNQRGRLGVEYSTKLQHESAFGRPTSNIWGEYEMCGKTDPDVSCATEFTCAQIRDGRFDVEPAKEEGFSEVIAQRHADFCKSQMEGLCNPGLPELVHGITEGFLWYGFALNEIVLQHVQHKLLPGGSGWGLAKLAERLPSSIKVDGWREDPTTGQLRSVVQQGIRPGGNWSSDIELPVERLLLLSRNRRGNNYQGVSILRPVHHICRVRRELPKLIGISLVREGAGIPVANAKDKEARLDPEQREAVQTLLENIGYHENAAAVMPPGWTIDWIYSPAANKGHVINAYYQLGEAILRQFQAQQMMLGTGNTGSRSVGEVHNAVADSFAQGIVASLESAFTDLYKRLVFWNFGPQPAYPKAKITLKKSKMPAEEKIRATRMAAEAGIITIRAADENVLREDLGMPTITPEERAEAQAEYTALLVSRAGLAPVGGSTPPSDLANKKSNVVQLADRKMFVPSRPLRPSEQALALQEMDEFLSGARDEFEKGAKPLVVEALVRALPDINEAMKDGDPSEVAKLTLDTERLSKFIGGFIERARGEGYRQVRGEMQRSLGDEYRAPVTLDDKGGGDDAGGKARADAAAKLFDAQRKQLLRRMTSRMISDIEREAIEVVRTGGDPAEVVSRVVQRTLDTGALKQDASLIVTKAFNMGREEFAQERGDEVDSVELTAILDPATCQPCADLDGKVFDFNSDEHIANTPPLSSKCLGGDNCRCLLRYNFKAGSGFKSVSSAA